MYRVTDAVRVPILPLPVPAYRYVNMADPLDYEDVTKAEFLLNPTVETDYCVEKPNILALERVCRESKVRIHEFRLPHI